MKSLDDKKQAQINRAQQMVIESYENRKNGAKDYTLDEAFDIVQRIVGK